jgi:Fur family ferric uptake transcriptional regulator
MNVIEADLDVAAEFTAKLRDTFGFETDMKHFAIFGRCRDCSLKNSTTPS